jgi:hypothetical protein
VLAVVKERPTLARVEPCRTMLSADFEKIGKLTLRDFQDIEIATLEAALLN